MVAAGQKAEVTHLLRLRVIKLPSSYLHWSKGTLLYSKMLIIMNREL